MLFSRRRLMLGLGAMAGFGLSSINLKAGEAKPTSHWPENPTQKLHKVHFQGLINSQFRLRSPTGQISSLRLVSLEEHKVDSKLEQFILKFKGPTQEVLEPEPYQFNHPTLGNFGLSISYAGVDQGEACYLAAICHL
ncbi:MAG: hypothetical protein QNJ46_20045 [Leptolyngbyaceae cyanobacterium MO_188.B28]|nr:hypothetical protein [Leptolyngbyaceae cyanobacterium MO_188.B28]